MTYPGGKAGSGVYHAIINLMPRHRVYIEPFLGGGAILRHKRPADTSWACEWDQNVFDAFTPGDQFRASPYLVDAWAATPGNDQKTFFNSAGAPNLWIKHQDALKFLREFNFQGERDHYLIYCDPPYLMETRSSKTRIYGDRDFSDWFSHEELLSLLVSLKCNVMISGYDHLLYNGRLEGWRKETFTAQTRGGPATECVWMNFAEPTELHDYRYLGKDYRERETIRKQQRRWVAKLREMPAMRRYALMSAIEEVLAPAQTAGIDENGGAIAPTDIAGSSGAAAGDGEAGRAVRTRSSLAEIDDAGSGQWWCATPWANGASLHYFPDGVRPLNESICKKYLLTTVSAKTSYPRSAKKCAECRRRVDRELSRALTDENGDGDLASVAAVERFELPGDNGWNLVEISLFEDCGIWASSYMVNTASTGHGFPRSDHSSRRDALRSAIDGVRKIANDLRGRELSVQSKKTKAQASKIIAWLDVLSLSTKADRASAKTAVSS